MCQVTMRGNCSGHAQKRGFRSAQTNSQSSLNAVEVQGGGATPLWIMSSFCVLSGCLDVNWAAGQAVAARSTRQ